MNWKFSCPVTNIVVDGLNVLMHGGAQGPTGAYEFYNWHKLLLVIDSSIIGQCTKNLTKRTAEARVRASRSLFRRSPGRAPKKTRVRRGVEYFNERKMHVTIVIRYSNNYMGCYLNRFKSDNRLVEGEAFRFILAENESDADDRKCIFLALQFDAERVKIGGEYKDMNAMILTNDFYVDHMKAGRLHHTKGDSERWHLL